MYLGIMHTTWINTPNEKDERKGGINHHKQVQSGSTQYNNVRVDGKQTDGEAKESRSGQRSGILRKIINLCKFSDNDPSTHDARPLDFSGFHPSLSPSPSLTVVQRPVF